MAKQARAQATREAILRAAGVVFATQAYSTATLADVISEAGVTQGALYFHFDSKHDLAVELIKKQHEEVLGGESAVPPGCRGLEALVVMSGKLAHQITTDPVVQGGLRLSTESSVLFPDYASKPYLDWIDTCTGFIREAVEERDLPEGTDAPAVARYIMSSFTGVQVVSQALTGWEDLFERLEEMWRFLIPSIASPDRIGALSDLPSMVHGSPVGAH